MAVIRQATEQDIPRIRELYRQLAFTPPPPDTPQPSTEELLRVFAAMRAAPGYELVVAESDGAVIGTLVLSVLPGFAHGISPFAIVEYVVVDEAYRSKGIGRLLMEYVITRAKETGCYKVILTSDKRRERAHEFYRSLGFEASAHGFRLYL